MKSTKQQGIVVYFNNNKSKTFETDDSQNGNEARISRPSPNVEQTTKRAYANKLIVTGGRKTQKREFARQCDKKYLELGFNRALVSPYV